MPRAAPQFRDSTFGIIIGCEREMDTAEKSFELLDVPSAGVGKLDLRKGAERNMHQYWVEGKNKDRCSAVNLE